MSVHIYVFILSILGASVQVRGSLVEERGNKEVQVNQKNHSVKVLGGVDQNYPLQKKKHTIEFLRYERKRTTESNISSNTFIKIERTCRCEVEATRLVPC